MMLCIAQLLSREPRAALVGCRKGSCGSRTGIRTVVTLLSFAARTPAAARSRRDAYDGALRDPPPVSTGEGGRLMCVPARGADAVRRPRAPYRASARVGPGEGPSSSTTALASMAVLSA